MSEENQGPEFTRNWFPNHKSRYWEEHLQEFVNQPKIHFLEIGVFEGRSSRWALENILTGVQNQAWGIDPFLYTKDSLQANADKIRQRLLENLAGFNFKLEVGTSFEVLMGKRRQQWIDYFHIIHVDGDHHSTNTYLDAMLSWDLLKSGGVMIFDDYDLSKDKFGRGDNDTPKIAVDQFIKEKGVEVLWKAMQVGIKKP